MLLRLLGHPRRRTPFLSPRTTDLYQKSNLTVTRLRKTLAAGAVPIALCIPGRIVRRHHLRCGMHGSRSTHACPLSLTGARPRRRHYRLRRALSLREVAVLHDKTRKSALGSKTQALLVLL